MESKQVCEIPLQLPLGALNINTNIDKCFFFSPLFIINRFRRENCCKDVPSLGRKKTDVLVTDVWRLTPILRHQFLKENKRSGGKTATEKKIVSVSLDYVPSCPEEGRVHSGLVSTSVASDQPEKNMSVVQKMSIGNDFLYCMCMKNTWSYAAIELLISYCV